MGLACRPPPARRLPAGRMTKPFIPPSSPQFMPKFRGLLVDAAGTLLIPSEPAAEVREGWNRAPARCLLEQSASPLPAASVASRLAAPLRCPCPLCYCSAVLTLLPAPLSAQVYLRIAKKYGCELSPDEVLQRFRCAAVPPSLPSPRVAPAASGALQPARSPCCLPCACAHPPSCPPPRAGRRTTRPGASRPSGTWATGGPSGGTSCRSPRAAAARRCSRRWDAESFASLGAGRNLQEGDVPPSLPPSGSIKQQPVCAARARCSRSLHPHPRPVIFLSPLLRSPPASCTSTTRAAARTT